MITIVTPMMFTQEDTVSDNALEAIDDYLNETDAKSIIDTIQNDVSRDTSDPSLSGTLTHFCLGTLTHFCPN